MSKAAFVRYTGRETHWFEREGVGAGPVPMKGLSALLFRKRNKHGLQSAATGPEGFGSPIERPQLYTINFDMMLKGSIHERRKGPVRQYGVTVNGSTRLVTSGDVVDQETYNALVAAGAIRPVVETPSPKQPPILDYTAAEHFEE